MATGGLSMLFKPNTDDTRESAAVALMQMIQEKGGVVHAYDPIAEFHPAHHGFEIVVGTSPYEIAQDAYAVVLATEWNEFKALDFAKLKQLMAHDVFVDARNALSSDYMKEQGFRYLRVGKK
jgi:UDPglucose 6-dehydrogenase